MTFLNKLPNVLALATAALLLGGTAHAEDSVQWGPDGKLERLHDGFPSGPLTIWTAHKPGHTDEVYARLLADAAKEYSPVPITVRPGAGGPALSFEIVRRFEQQTDGLDGRNLVVAEFSSTVVRSHTVDVGEFTVEDLADMAVILTEQEGFLLVAGTDSEWSSFEEFLAFAKENPGRVKVGTSVIGSGAHVHMAMLDEEAGLDLVYVPHDSVGRAQQTLLGGGVDVATTLVSQSAPLINQGKLKPLLQWSLERSPAFPDTPAAPELGFEGQGATRGFVVHPDTPEMHADWLHALFAKAVESEAYQERINNLGLIRMEMGPEEIANFVRVLDERVAPVIQALGLEH